MTLRRSSWWYCMLSCLFLFSPIIWENQRMLLVLCSYLLVWLLSLVYFWFNLLDDVNFFLKKFINQNVCCICSYDRAKQRYSKNKGEKLSPGAHLASAAEAGAMVSNYVLIWYWFMDEFHGLETVEIWKKWHC